MKRSTGRRTRRLPTLATRTLELSGIYGGPEFIGWGVDALRRVRRSAAILRGDLLRYGEARCPPAVEHQAPADPFAADQGDGMKGWNGSGRCKG